MRPFGRPARRGCVWEEVRSRPSIFGVSLTYSSQKLFGLARTKQGLRMVRSTDQARIEKTRFSFPYPLGLAMTRVDDDPVVAAVMRMAVHPERRTSGFDRLKSVGGVGALSRSPLEPLGYPVGHAAE